LPKKLAEELKRRFAYALDPSVKDFSPFPAAATFLNPEYYRLLSPDLCSKASVEISKWLERIPANEDRPPPISSTNFFSRLLTRAPRAEPNPSQRYAIIY
jgi:hypothetical protein